MECFSSLENEIVCPHTKQLVIALQGLPEDVHECYLTFLTLLDKELGVHTIHNTLLSFQQ
jgi:hypothetical protein